MIFLIRRNQYFRNFPIFLIDVGPLLRPRDPLRKHPSDQRLLVMMIKIGKAQIQGQIVIQPIHQLPTVTCPSRMSGCPSTSWSGRSRSKLKRQNPKSDWPLRRLSWRRTGDRRLTPLMTTKTTADVCKTITSGRSPKTIIRITELHQELSELPRLRPRPGQRPRLCPEGDRRRLLIWITSTEASAIHLSPWFPLKPLLVLFSNL